ncbi:hypothetical protein [Bacillus norwichensis]|uniref:Uncharacterized protein n=1 Tax=Bacillus norwichensis TaxID=2762217 RepID=A0ABR8VLS3_9BACI|nr:hypothetical protein [Bacillus norwichensis]MBD8005708.1 hypothetical protein [Bacillus norwichensis]
MRIAISFTGVQIPADKVKASGGCDRFSKEIHRAKLDKIWAQIRQDEFDSYREVKEFCLLAIFARH